jgi:predicted alpha-1,6-mannanase (GH76 family)
MLRLFSISGIFIFFSLLSTVNSNNEPLNWAEVTASRLVTCHYNESSGIWIDESAWQSGNTLESLANFISLLDSPLKYVFNQTYIKTDMFVGGDCFDDFQWWLLGWVQAYSVDPNIKYLQRAAGIHDVVTKRAWDTTQCGGGVFWCPVNGYKNAITNELFLTSSMRLHPYATLLGKPATYYLDWALKEWQWFENSGMINKDYLINDGLNVDDNICVNNNQTTWTYNQGVLLSGLALLYNATQNATLLNVAQNIIDTTIQHLTYPNGILKEPCEPNCDTDQKLFKGIFARHLSYLLPYLTDAVHIQKYTSFLQQNALSLWTTDRCEKDGLFGLFWDNYASDSCDSPRNTATTSSGLDLFISAAKTQQPPSSSKWMLLGLGNCVDDNNVSMPNFYNDGVNETVCRTMANEDAGVIAYDYQLRCDDSGFCRIRTLSDQTHTPPGFEYEDGSARSVTRTNKAVLTNCYLKID